MRSIRSFVLQRKVLSQDTAHELLHAVSLLGWQPLYSTLERMAQNKHDQFVHWDKAEQACQGLLLLLGMPHT